MPRTRQDREELKVPAGDELLTVHEVAHLLRVDDTTCRRWIKEGILEAITLPHPRKRQAYRIKKSVIDEITTSRKVEPSHV